MFVKPRGEAGGVSNRDTSLVLLMSSHALKVEATVGTLYHFEPREYNTLLASCCVPFAEHVIPAASVSGDKFTSLTLLPAACTYDAEIVSRQSGRAGGQYF